MGSGAVIVNQPGVYLVNADGDLITLTDAGTIGDAEGLIIMGKDGTVARMLSVDGSGNLAIQNPPNLDAALSTLATETKLEAVRALLATIDADTSNLDVALSTRATEATVATLATESKLEAVRALLATIDADTSNLDAPLSTLATESKLESVRALLATIDADTSVLAGVDYSTQTTLAAADAKLATIDAVLDAIKDTDGVADLAAWLGSTAPTVGQKIMADSLPVTVASDQSPLLVSTSAAAASGAFAAFLRDSGGTGSEDMVVNGSGTPVVFKVAADPTDDIRLESVRVVFSATSFQFAGDAFGKGGGILSNGVDISIMANNGTFSTMLLELFVNEDFLRLLDTTVAQAGSTDVLAATLPFSGNTILEAGTADEVTVTIQDNLTGGARGISYFTATAYGVVL